MIMVIFEIAACLGVLISLVIQRPSVPNERYALRKNLVSERSKKTAIIGSVECFSSR
jgi:hypothetical protein